MAELDLTQIKKIGVEAIVENMHPEDVDALLQQLWELEEREKYGKFGALFPDNGHLCRERYVKHMEFFSVGRQYRERCFMAGNRVGKTVAGSYELVCHLTGDYPPWWTGRVFKTPIRAWAAGKTNETTRDIIQLELLGNITFLGQRKVVDGTGLIPRQLLGTDPGEISWKAGITDLVDTIRVRHRTGRWSELGLKSYQQGRGSFEGTARHVIWFDEEPPLDVYNEALIRTATTQGLIYVTFTPLEGMSEVVVSFLPADQRPGGGSDW